MSVDAIGAKPDHLSGLKGITWPETRNHSL
jgi:hypothetical protein